MRSLLGAARLLVAFSFLVVPAPLLAQYMYLDSNGDGVHTVADIMAPTGTPLVVDAWINTNHNKDGSLAVCNTGDGDLGIWNSYAVQIHAFGGTVEVSNFVNQVPEFFIGCVSVGVGFVSNSTDMAACMATGVPKMGGHVRMFTVTVTALTGAPTLEFVTTNSLSPNFTSFGTPCSGTDFDSTYKLGTDWFDADGLGNAGCDLGCSPTLNPIADMTVNEGATASQTITATDPDSDVITFQKFSGPVYMTVSTTGPGVGSIVLTPGFADATSGAPASVVASDGPNISNIESFLITVVAVNRAPVADAGGPYSGVTGVPIAFDGTGSSDPDGSPLTFAWNFGDLTFGTGPTPAHVYAAEGLYGIALTVSDGALFNTATTTATITDVFDARAFTTKANRLLRLGSGKPYWTIQVEPIAQSFNVGEVGIGTIRIKSEGTGTVSEIHVVLGKTSVQGDADGNGVADIAATFAKTDLEALFSNVSGSTSVTVTIEGDLTSGGIFQARADIGIVGGGGSAAAPISPNPLNPSGTIRYSMSAPGRVRLELFDVSGRLVRLLADEEVPTGPQQVAFDGRGRDGRPLASGVYYLRIATPDGARTHPVAVVK